MRERIRRAAAKLTDAVDLNDFEKEALRRDGRKAAAWLVGSQRWTFRRWGKVLFEVAAGQRLPPWYKVAVAALQQSERWSVEVTGSARSTTYVVRWLGWRVKVRRKEAPQWSLN